MDSVLRASAIYLFLLLLFRLAGKRTFAELTPFDFVLLLVIGEATQQGLLGEDFSVTNAFIVITTLVTIDVVMAAVKQRSSFFDRLLEGRAVLLIDDGDILRDRMRKAKIDEYDVMESARNSHGLEELDQIKYAVLERSGGISVIPR